MFVPSGNCTSPMVRPYLSFPRVGRVNQSSFAVDMESNFAVSSMAPHFFPLPGPSFFSLTWPLIFSLTRPLIFSLTRPLILSITWPLIGRADGDRERLSVRLIQCVFDRYCEIRGSRIGRSA